MHKDMVHKQANAFNERQRDIDRRLRDITLSKSSDEATLKFEASMERLLRLDMAKGYMELLGRVDSIRFARPNLIRRFSYLFCDSKEILSLTQSSPSDALRNYLDLRGIASMLKASQVAADGAAPHLVDYTTKLAETLKSKIRTEYSGRLRASLDKMKWPAKDLQLDDFVIREWSYWTELLLQLQEPCVAMNQIGVTIG